MKKIYWPFAGLAIALLIYFVFIPAFSGTLLINPIIQLGPLAIRWYGLILALSIFLSFIVIRKQSWKLGISQADVDDYSFWAIIAAILGARIYYVLFSWSYFSQNLYEAYKIWHGGLSIYGAVLGGIIFTYFYSRKKAYSFWQLSDLVVLGLPVGQALGRLGNFVNQEAFGGPTNLPWKMYVQPANRPTNFMSSSFFHPAFLYEMIASGLIFLLIYKLFGKVRSGSIFLTYLLAYSVARWLIESFRTDSFFVYGFRGDQLVAFAIIVVSAALLYFREIRSPKH